MSLRTAAMQPGYMKGLIVNSVAILLGGLFGLLFKRWISKNLVESVQQALGLCVVVIGVKMALEFKHVLLMISCVALGGAIGHAVSLEKNIELGVRNLQQRVRFLHQGTFSEAFVSTSILFCTGAMAVIGAIQSTLLEQHDVLFAKALIDGILSVVFAAIWGIGVALSAVSVFLYQGSIALLASLFPGLSQPAILAEVSGVSGVLLLMVGLKLSGIKNISVGNYLPAIPLVLLLAYLLKSYGVIA